MGGVTTRGQPDGADEEEGGGLGTADANSEMFHSADEDETEE